MSDPSNGTVTDRLIGFVSKLNAADLPAPVRCECVRAFVNAIGCTVGGARHSIVDVAHAALSEFSGRAVASLFGRGEKTDSLHAALLNGLAGAAYSFDDTYSDALLHPSGPVAVALLALAERTPATGINFLSAFAAGVEVACRLTKAVAVPPAEGEMAWSQTGIVCGAAAALAAGKLLRLDNSQLGWALGIAVSEAAGTRVAHGSMAASLIFGHAAQTGLRAALLAAKGFTSSRGCIENRYGFASVFARKSNISALVDGLGENFELMLNTYKPFPCGLVIHPAIDAMLRLRGEQRFDSNEIERIMLTVSRGAVEFCFRPDPKDDVDAKLSLHHWVAVAAARGKAGIAEGTLAVVNHPDIQRLRAVMDVEADPSIANDAGEVTVQLKNGARVSRRVDHCLGSIECPMSDGELETKFIDQAEVVIGPERARDLLATCWNIETLPDVALIARKAC